MKCFSGGFQPGDFAGVLVPSSREADHDVLVRRPLAGQLHGLGNGMGTFQSRQDTFGPRQLVEGAESRFVIGGGFLAFWLAYFFLYFPRRIETGGYGDQA